MEGEVGERQETALHLPPGAAALFLAQVTRSECTAGDPRVSQLTVLGPEFPVETWLSSPVHTPGSFLWASVILSRA